MFIEYPKMKTLFKLNPLGENGRKWDATSGEILPETAPLHFIPLEELVFTEKIDGTNMGMRIVNGSIDHVQKRNGICNRDDKNDQFYFEVADKVIADILKAGVPIDNYLIFGELCGTKIQKGGNYFDERKFLVFDILNIYENKFFTWDAVVYFANIMGLETVPQIQYSKNNLEVNNVKDFINNLKSTYNEDYNAEGFVVRHGKDCSIHRRWIAKIRRKDFML